MQIMWLSNWILKFYLILISLNWNRLKRLGHPGCASGKELACQFRRSRRLRVDPWVGKIPGGGHGNLLQSSCLENSMDRRAWRPAVHRVAKSRTQLKRLSIHAFRLVWLVMITLDNTTRDPQTAYAPSLWIHLVLSFQNQIWWGRYLNVLWMIRSWWYQTFQEHWSGLLCPTVLWWILQWQEISKWEANSYLLSAKHLKYIMCVWQKDPATSCLPRPWKYLVGSLE